MLIRIFFSIFLSAAAVSVCAQNTDVMKQKALGEIQRRGLDEREVRARLLDNGIDIDRIRPEQLPFLQAQIEAILNAESKRIPVLDSTEAGSSPAPQSTSQLPDRPLAAPPAVAEIKKTEAPRSDIYGKHLFYGDYSALYAPLESAAPPDRYVLGPGDEITVSIFGPSQFDAKFTLNKEGYINPSNMPKIFLKGLDLARARQLLQSRFGAFYRFSPEQFSFSVGKTRSVSLHVFGEARAVGAFSVPALYSPFNALVKVGGPSELGSVRSIKLIRNGQTRVFDLYAFLDDPSVQGDFYLEDNDVLQIPVAERVVKIEGAVKRPFGYELKKEENLSALMKLAGGMRPDAFRELVQVRRFSGNERIMVDVDLRNQPDFPLLDGDEVIVRRVGQNIENKVLIEGAVSQPGSFSISETPRLSDLVKKAGLRREARTDVAFLLRSNPDSTSRFVQANIARALAEPGGAADFPLVAGDRLTIYSEARYTDRYTVSILGAVRDTLLDYPYDPEKGIRLQQAILLAGGLQAGAAGNGYILRGNPANAKEKNYVPVNFRAAMDNPESPDNILLQPLDEVRVLFKSDFTDISEVRVVGAVRNPGVFQYAPSLTLKDVLTLSGGLRMEAALNRVDVFRVQMTENSPTKTLSISVQVDPSLNIVNGGGDFQLQPFDEIVVRSVPDFELQEMVELNGEVLYPGRYALLDDNERMSSLIQRAGGLTPEADARSATLFRTEGNKGLIVTRLREALLRKNGPEDHVLKSGDVLTIPKSENLVSIRTANTHAAELYSDKLLGAGAVNVAYQPGRRAGWYVKNYAGGFSKSADRKHVSVRKPNGKINRTVSVWPFKFYPRVAPGAIVNVPYKAPAEKKTKIEKKGIDWDKTLTQVLAVGTTLALLITALNK